MGERVEFPSNGHTCQGYFAGKGPGIVVIQEWWGLTDWIKDNAKRLAAQGYVCLAPDLYHGKSTTDPTVARYLTKPIKVDVSGGLSNSAAAVTGSVSLLGKSYQLAVRAEWLGARILDMPVDWTDQPDSKSSARLINLSTSIQH